MMINDYWTVMMILLILMCNGNENRNWEVVDNDINGQWQWMIIIGDDQLIIV